MESRDFTLRGILIPLLSLGIGASVVLDIGGKSSGFAQSSTWICRVGVVLQNSDRYVATAPEVECSEPHTVPWGNWGVDSNGGIRYDGHQFQGWCHNPPYWYLGCWESPWYEWNSCRSYRPPPNCTYYNEPDCQNQRTTQGVNDHAGFIFGDYNVSEPTPDGYGGCRDLEDWPIGVYNNYMTLYELDPNEADDFVQTLYFPNTSVTVQCSSPEYCYGEGLWQPLTGRNPPDLVYNVSAMLRQATWFELIPPDPD